MKILLLHPSDSPLRGPWSEQKWDLVVDLGKCSEATADAWKAQLGCPVLRLETFRRNLEDSRHAGRIMRTGFGRLVDQYGLDWWELTSLHIHAEVETAVALRQLISEAKLSGALYGTRRAWPVTGVAALLGCEIRTFEMHSSFNLFRRLGYYARAYRRLSFNQSVQIFCDKYDASYRWRSRLASTPAHRHEDSILVPSAYTNVSRKAGEYARSLPDEKFLFVITRQSGRQFEIPANGVVAPLAAYARSETAISATADLLGKWADFLKQLQQVPELDLLARLGQFAPVERWLAAGPAVRDAWLAVLHQERISAVLCGDDSNWYTRLPVLLARKQKIPTLDFHHGAFDGRFLLKDLSSDFYLAKNEMERDYLIRVCGLPTERIVVPTFHHTSSPPLRKNVAAGSQIVYFSEPYESQAGRPQEVYRELLPALADLARNHDRELVVKLHPFENASERKRFVKRALGPDKATAVKIISGPLSPHLLASTWFGITVESSTVLDCAKNGVPCFLCEWLALGNFGYIQQFARFGVGRLLHSPAELNKIPHLLAEWDYGSGTALDYDESCTAETLRQWLKGSPVPASE